MAAFQTVDNAVAGVVVVLLVDYLREHQAWGWLRLIQGAMALPDAPGLRFAKVMGSGQGGGFSLRPSASHQGLIAVFDRAQQAADFLAGSHARAMQERARASWAGLMAVDSARGQWDEAIRWQREAVERHPLDPHHRLVLAMHLLDSGDPVAAREALESTSGLLFPREADNRFRAYVEERLGSR